MNEELINSAVSFLKDPQVGGSPLTKKVEFLESKGLNQEEIEEALKRANDNSTTTSSSSSSSSVASSNLSNTTSSPSYQSQQQQQQVYSQPPIDYYNVVPPPLPEKSWKDYFIMATATAGVTYGLYQVVTRYLIPSIIPPSQSSIDKDKETINEEFMKIDKILDQLTFEQEEIKHANETKLSEIDTVIENVNDFLNKYNKDKLKFDDDLRLMKLEIDNLNNSIEKNMHLTKENINDELGEISQELQSLKNLIKARSGSNNNQTNGGNGGGIEARKIAPVSSIPSASEILKKARAKNAASTTPEPKHEPKQEPVKSEDTKSEETKSNETKSQETKRSEGITKNGVMAAGIPSWQLQHKEKEAQEKEAQKKSNQEQTSNNNNNNNNSSGIPVWQQAAAATTSSVDTSKSEDEIKEKIKSVGVPAWQLNASTSSGSGSYNNNNINGNDNSKNGPQQQQQSSSAE